MTQNALARLLAPFEIRSRTVRLADGATPKGYLAGQFEDAWNRYTPGNGFQTATPPQPASLSQNPALFEPPQEARVAVAGMAANPHEHWDVADVAVANAENGQLANTERDRLLSKFPEMAGEGRGTP